MANSGDVWRYQARPVRSRELRLSIDGSVYRAVAQSRGLDLHDVPGIEIGTDRAQQASP